MHHTTKEPFIEHLTEITGQDPSQCYQCGKCSAGCPVREFAVDAPNKIVRYVQLGFYEQALTSKTIWLCAGCQTCSSRCPKNFNLAGFMDAVREMSIAYGIEPADKDTAKFHESFMSQIDRYGKSFEMGLILDYKMKTMHLMQDVDLAPSMIAKGKMSFIPHFIKQRDVVRKIIENSRQHAPSHEEKSNTTKEG